MKEAEATAQQMQDAPEGALYVCPDADYAAGARAIGRSIGRPDLMCVPAMFLERGRWADTRFSAVVLDSHCRLTDRQRQGFNAARCQIPNEPHPRPRSTTVDRWPWGEDAERTQRRHGVRRRWVELGCPQCGSRGQLVATAEKHERGLVHACIGAGCSRRVAVPGEPYPRVIEEIDPDSSVIT